MRWSLFGGLFALLLSLSPVHAATLGIPVHGGTHSGIGVISGWKCDAVDLTVRFNGGAPIPLLHGSQRPDVLNAGACPHADVGFVAIWNWNELSDGRHTAVVYDDGVAFDRATFEVVTPGVAFLRGVFSDTLTFQLSNGQRAEVEWSEAVQGFVATDYSFPPGTGVGVGGTGVCASKEARTDPLRWVVRNPCEDGSTLYIDLHALRHTGEMNVVYLEIVQEGYAYHGRKIGTPENPPSFSWREVGEGEWLGPVSGIFLGPGETAFTQIVIGPQRPPDPGHPDPPNFLEPYEIHWRDTLLFAFP